MMEIELCKYLHNITNLDVTPIFALGPYPAVAYKVTPINGGVVKTSQAEVRIIGDDYDRLLSIKQTILNNTDLTEQDPSLNFDNIVVRSELAGGGDLYNDEIQMWEVVILLVLTWRCKK